YDRRRGVFCARGKRTLRKQKVQTGCKPAPNRRLPQRENASHDNSLAGAPEEIRTPDPQIRSLVLYPAELRALLRIAREIVPEPAEAAGNGPLAIGFGRYWQVCRGALTPVRARRAGCRDRPPDPGWTGGRLPRWCRRPGGFRRRGRAPARP